VQVGINCQTRTSDSQCSCFRDIVDFSIEKISSFSVKCLQRRSTRSQPFEEALRWTIGNFKRRYAYTLSHTIRFKIYHIDSIVTYSPSLLRGWIAKVGRFEPPEPRGPSVGFVNALCGPQSGSGVYYYRYGVVYIVYFFRE
jgi:hypothetical protein